MTAVLKSRYKTISCVYLFDQPDIMNKALVFCLAKPLRQGQQTYPHLVLYAPTDYTTISLNLDEVSCVIDVMLLLCAFMWMSCECHVNVMSCECHVNVMWMYMQATLHRMMTQQLTSQSVLAERYGGRLQPNMRDEGYKLIAKLFKFIGGVKLYTSDTFHTSRGMPYVRCVHKSEGGLLYFMERTLFFIHKPTLQIAYDVGENGGCHS